MSGLYLFLLFPLAHRVLCASQIVLFSDTSCKDSLHKLTGPNGYPNGTCTDLRSYGPYGSLQVVGLDPGCTVTIYVKNTSVDMCSGDQKEVQLANCWNSTYVYYSIDFCDAGALQSQFPTPTGASSLRKLRPSIGPIIGGVVAGVLALGIVLGLVAFMVRKKHIHNTGVPQASGMAGNEAFGYKPQELPGRTMFYKRNVVEMEQPPVELAVRERRSDRGL